ncbi:MAG: D-alanyl-D-alanine carboxypeptidase [Clostridia bacterium]|nr:D-alanyl-D-alanine carboxypeptidase [Oscillospiraceae bacterium]MBQ2746187.1 D-alanyl-D-alanine carboxypeptidase [Clostridia bacterium]
MKRMIAYILCICLLSVSVSAATVSMEWDADDLDKPLSTTAQSENVTQLDIKAKSVILMEVMTGTVLYENNADEKTAPASITKIMSLLLVMDAIKQGTLKLDTVITATEHACSMGGSQIWLEPGEQMSVHELLKAAVIASANDAMVALGEAVAGSEEGFVALMNEKAKALGMNNTHFVNCTGLDAEGHLTSAHDVAIASSELIKYDLIKEYSTVWMDSLRNGESELVNTNKLVRFYEGCTGLKTGTTSKAGYCLSATADKNGMQLVAVVMDADSSTDRFEGAKKLLNYGYANYNYKNIEAEIDEKTVIPIKKGVAKYALVVPDGTLNILLPKRTVGDITQTVQLDEFVTAPAKAGTKVGTVKVMSGDSEIGVIDLKLSKDVERINITHTFMWLVRALFCL